MFKCNKDINLHLIYIWGLCLLLKHHWMEKRERRERRKEQFRRSICLLGGSGLSCLTLTALLGFQLLSFSLCLCPSCFISLYPSCDDFKYLRNYSFFVFVFQLFSKPIAWLIFPLCFEESFCPCDLPSELHG